MDSRCGKSYDYYQIMKVIPWITREGNSLKDPIPKFNIVREGRSINYQCKYFILPIIFNSSTVPNTLSSSSNASSVSKILNLGLWARVNDLSFFNEPDPKKMDSRLGKLDIERSDISSEANRSFTLKVVSLWRSIHFILFNKTILSKTIDDV